MAVLVRAARARGVVVIPVRRMLMEVVPAPARAPGVNKRDLFILWRFTILMYASVVLKEGCGTFCRAA